MSESIGDGIAGGLGVEGVEASMDVADAEDSDGEDLKSGSRGQAEDRILRPRPRLMSTSRIMLVIVHGARIAVRGVLYPGNIASGLMERSRLGRR